jgi:hypothetical protein
MIDPKQIPDEVLKVLAKELPGYEHNTTTTCYALAAALSAWPGVVVHLGAKVTKTWRDPGKIILPLPKESK